MPLSTDDIRAFIAQGREQAGVEFKGPGVRTDAPFVGRVVRGMLAMANRRDGGFLVVGVREDGNALIIDGLDAAECGTWKHDHLADTVANYADPRIDFDSYFVEIDAKQVLVIAVREFEDVPVICKRSLADGNKLILRDGAVYVRSNRKPESREVANFDEMRELLDIATDRGVRRFVTRAQSAGIDVVGGVRKGASEAFRTERGSL